MTDRILVRNLVVFAHHGVLPEEAVEGQRFEIDLTGTLDLAPAGRTDDLGRSVSYAEMVRLALGIMTERRFNLIEAAAETLAEALLAAFPLLAAISVEIRKPSAPIDAVFDHVGVSITRSRRAAGLG